MSAPFELRWAGPDRRGPLSVAGRLDGVHAPELADELRRAVDGGARDLSLDLSGVTFLSSAGLRVLVQVRGALDPLGGRLSLAAPSREARAILELSGFHHLFPEVARPGPAPLAEEREAGGVRLRVLRSAASPGRAWELGDPAPLASASYGAGVAGDAAALRWGAFVGAFGTAFEEWGPLSGEGVVLDGHAFTLPGVPQSRVDVMHREARARLGLLHGCGFTGEFQVTASFEGDVDLAGLVRLLAEMLATPRIGFALLAESHGLLTMQLRRAPVAGPSSPADLFDPAVLPSFLDFDLEPACFGAALAAAGVAGSSGLPVHAHAALFGREPLARAPERFAAELERLARNGSPSRVVHLLPESRLRGGLVAATPLEG